MFLIEDAYGYIIGYTDNRPEYEESHEVEDDNEYYTFLKDYHPYKKVKVNPDGTMYYVVNTERKKSHERIEFKRSRDTYISNYTVEYEGMVFDADELSQNRMLRPIALLQNATDTQLWVLSDNTSVHVTKAQFMAVLKLANEKQTSVWVQS